jgi:DNA-binding NarL/FixJ family response regulator
MEPIRILIADDHQPFRRGLRAMLTSETDLTVVGETETGQETVVLAESMQPDLILMDLHMPGVNGLEATRRILHTSPHIRVLVLTMADDDESVFAALQAGARGYLVKGALKADVLRAIRAVYNGDAIFSPAVAQRLIHYFTTARPQLAAESFPELTDRERQILTLMVQNHTTQGIADILVLSVKTVRNHISNICTKLEVADRTQAILRAKDIGFGI